MHTWCQTQSPEEPHMLPTRIKKKFVVNVTLSPKSTCLKQISSSLQQTHQDNIDNQGVNKYQQPKCLDLKWTDHSLNQFESYNSDIKNQDLKRNCFKRSFIYHQSLYKSWFTKLCNSSMSFLAPTSSHPETKISCFVNEKCNMWVHKLFPG